MRQEGQHTLHMINYIFWPSEVFRKESQFEDKPLLAIAIKLEGADHVVLDVEPLMSFEKCTSLKYPYTIIGKRDVHGNWSIDIPDFIIVEFEVPKLRLMQFFSVEPISLILPEKEIADEGSYRELTNLEGLVNYERYQTKNENLRKTVDVINLYHSHLYAFKKTYPNIGHFNENLDIGISSLQKWYTSTAIHKILCHTLFYLTIGIYYITFYGSLLLRTTFSSLVNISATAKQIDLRFQQFCYFPSQFLRIKKNVTLREEIPHFDRPTDKSDSTKKELPCKYYPDYIRFYNTIWLIVNDLSFGLIIGAYLKDHHEIIVDKLSELISTTLYDKMINVTQFLAGNPFGIKLNDELASFLSELFLWIIEFSYNSLIKFTSDKDKLSTFFKFVTRALCTFGASFGISLIIDFFSLLSFHIYLFYHISSKIYYWQVNAMISLFYLFCGKKRNILRQRIDYDYFELDELLMGTLLFIVLVFLMPTVLSFYFCYTLLWLLAVYIHIILDSAIGLINHFPLFALLLRIKDPKRLPGGILISSKRLKSNVLIFKLANNPLKVNMMFKPFSSSMNKIKGNYFSMSTFKKLISGVPIKVNRSDLYDVLYSSLPEKPGNITELIPQLGANLPDGKRKMKK